jgi:hypothetical protein
LEKEKLLGASTYSGEVLTKGILRKKAFWKPYFMIVSGISLILKI